MATQTVKYYEKTSFGSWTRRKTQVQDDTYGIAGKSITLSRLGVVKDGKLYIGDELLALLNTMNFKDSIPDFPAAVSQYLPSEQWPSYLFDPDDPATYPQTETPEGITRGWECQDSRYPGRHYQNMHWNGIETAEEWRVLHVCDYRRQTTGSDHPRVPNPEYPIIEAQRAEAGQVYSNLIRTTFVPVASYQFQGLPLNAAGEDRYQWSIDGVKSPPIPGHRLAVVAGSTGAGWKLIPTPMRNPEKVIVNTSGGAIVRDLYESIYSIKEQSTTWDLTKDLKMAYLIK